MDNRYCTECGMYMLVEEKPITGYVRQYYNPDTGNPEYEGILEYTCPNYTAIKQIPFWKKLFNFKAFAEGNRHDHFWRILLYDGTTEYFHVPED